MLQLLGPEIAEILLLPGPEIAVMLQSDFWAQKLRLCSRDPLFCELKGYRISRTFWRFPGPKNADFWRF